MAVTVRHSFDKLLDQQQVLFEGNSCVRKVILNRPEKLNSLTYHMISKMIKELKAHEDDSNVKLVILKGNGKAFCAGGDIVASYTFMVAGHWRFGAKLYKRQLILDHLVATYTKPVVALLDGIVMGGGAGLSMHAKYRIVTENTVFAMPEAAIGHFPDVGSSYFLSRLPGYLGEYLGLTGAHLNGAEMVECGLATHFVPSKYLHLLENEIDDLTSPDVSAISMIIGKFAHKPTIKQDSVCRRLVTIHRCFSRNTVEEILSSLENEVLENGSEKWKVRAINSIESASPTSLKLSLRSIREGRLQGLEECLIREYTTFCHIKRGTVSKDFYEGVRAMLLDRDKKPKWEPSKLELVTDEMIDQCFSKVDEDDWQFLQLPTRNNLQHLARPKL